MASWEPHFRRIESSDTAKVGLGGVGIGLTMGLSAMFAMQTSSFWCEFFIFVFLVSVFHVLEFTMTSLFHTDTINFDSFLLNHSRDYHTALIAAVIEFWLEFIIFDCILGYQLKSINVMSVLGALVMLAGQIIRTTAMIQCGRNFTHIISDNKKPEHVLVTHGIYKYCRHPSYLGWFMWSLGSQMILCNPVCVAAYFYACHKFFTERLLWEEETLLSFFGDKFREYHANTPTYIPFVPGPPLPPKKAD